MRKAGLRILIGGGCAFVGLMALSFFRSGPWANVGFGGAMFSALFMVYGVRDLVYEACIRLRMNVSRDAVSIHVWAATAAGIAYLLTFFDPDPRVASVKWVMLIAMPLGVYIVSCALNWLSGSGSKSLPERQPRKKKPRAGKPPAA